MDAVVDPCRRFRECEGCSHCSESPRCCEYCADPWDECLCDFKNLPVFCDECDERVEACKCEDEGGGDLFTTCEECGWFGIPIDGEGMAAELCESCEAGQLSAVRVVRSLSELLVDLEGMHLPDMSANAKADYLRTIGEAVALLRTHAVPESHPWAVK